MRIPIRMIGIATTFFWLFLILFFVSAVYSVKEFRIDLGDPQITITPDNKTVFSLPVIVDNQGYYNIGSFNVTTEILDDEGFTITQGSTFLLVIERGTSTTITHNMTIDVNQLLQGSRTYLFNDTELEIQQTIGMKLAEVIPVQASTNISMPWGAPLYNFRLGEIQYLPVNLTHMTATIPVNFENHAIFPLTGNIMMRMYNSTDTLVGEGQTTIDTSENMPYQGYVELTVRGSSITENGNFQVSFSTPFFTFPLVIPYG